MIYHQSKYGHTIKMTSELYYSLSDQELEEIEERYINANIGIIGYSGTSTYELDDIIDGPSKRINLSDYDEE